MVLISVSLMSLVIPEPAALPIPTFTALDQLNEVPAVAEVASYTKGAPSQMSIGANALVRTGVGLTSTVTICTFEQPLAAAVTTGSGTARCIIRRNQFNAGAGTITTGIDGTGADVVNGVLIVQNLFGVNHGISVGLYDAAEALLSMNYIFTVGTGTGGTLIDDIA